MFVDLTEGGQKSLMKWNVGVVSGGREVGGEGPRCSSWKRRERVCQAGWALMLYWMGWNATTACSPPSLFPPWLGCHCGCSLSLGFSGLRFKSLFLFLFRIIVKAPGGSCSLWPRIRWKNKGNLIPCLPIEFSLLGPFLKFWSRRFTWTWGHFIWTWLNPLG